MTTRRGFIGSLLALIGVPVASAAAISRPAKKSYVYITHCDGQGLEWRQAFPIEWLTRPIVFDGERWRPGHQLAGGTQ